MGPPSQLSYGICGLFGLALAHVELEEDYVAVRDLVPFALLAVTAGCLHSPFGALFFELVERHDLCTDDARTLRCLVTLAEDPRPNLVGPCRVEETQVDH